MFECQVTYLPLELLTEIVLPFRAVNWEFDQVDLLHQKHESKRDIITESFLKQLFNYFTSGRKFDLQQIVNYSEGVTEITVLWVQFKTSLTTKITDNKMVK